MSKNRFCHFKVIGADPNTKKQILQSFLFMEVRNL